MAEEFASHQVVI